MKKLNIPLRDGLVLMNASAEHADQLGALQHIVFPTLSESEIIQAEHFRIYTRVFPEGQFVVLDGERVAASTSTMRCHFDFEHPAHTFLEFTDNLTISTHVPDAPWLYGLDVMVHPDYRQRGLARALYRARAQYVREQGMLGQITTGMLNGYVAYKEQMSPEEYFEKLRLGEVYDPTVSTQQKIGWEVVGLIPDYLDDPQCGNYGVLMVLPGEKEI